MDRAVFLALGFFDKISFMILGEKLEVLFTQKVSFRWELDSSLTPFTDCVDGLSWEI